MRRTLALCAALLMAAPTAALAQGLDTDELIAGTQDFLAKRFTAEVGQAFLAFVTESVCDNPRTTEYFPRLCTFNEGLGSSQLISLALMEEALREDLESLPARLRTTLWCRYLMPEQHPCGGAASVIARDEFRASFETRLSKLDSTQQIGVLLVAAVTQGADARDQLAARVEQILTKELPPTVRTALTEWGRIDQYRTERLAERLAGAVGDLIRTAQDSESALLNDLSALDADELRPLLRCLVQSCADAELTVHGLVGVSPQELKRKLETVRMAHVRRVQLRNLFDAGNAKDREPFLALSYLQTQLMVRNQVRKRRSEIISQVKEMLRNGESTAPLPAELCDLGNCLLAELELYRNQTSWSDATLSRQELSARHQYLLTQGKHLWWSAGTAAQDAAARIDREALLVRLVENYIRVEQVRLEFRVRSLRLRHEIRSNTGDARAQLQQLAALESKTQARLFLLVSEQLVDLQRRSDSQELALLSRVTPLLFELSKAGDREEVAATLNAFSSPVGAWRLKRSTDGSFISFGALVGFYGGREQLYDPHRLTGYGYDRDSYGVFAPIGVDFSYRIGNASTIGLFVSLIDLGAVMSVVSTNGTADGTYEAVEANPNTEFENLLAPGVLLRMGVGDSPFVWGIGWTANPNLRNGIPAANPETRDKLDANRALIFFAVDIVILPFF